jgi:RNA polymerase sigma-70 factor (ECF subfamily)
MGMTPPQLRPNEAELIKSVCDGEREAFYELMRPYERMIYATAIAVLKNPADAEEVAQEAVMKAFSNKTRSDKPSRMQSICSVRSTARFLSLGMFSI